MFSTLLDLFQNHNQVVVLTGAGVSTASGIPDYRDDTGSSLMVYSGYRFACRVHENEIPIVAINRGVTRADDILSMKIEQDCGPVLAEVVEALDSFSDDVSLEFQKS